MTGNVNNWLNVRNGLKWLEMAGNDWERMKMYMKMLEN